MIIWTGSFDVCLPFDIKYTHSVGVMIKTLSLPHILTWHFISMLKKSSLGSWWSPSPTRCPRLLCVIRSPGRFPTLTRWSSRRRLWELAIKSKSSSVWGEVVTAGSKRQKRKSLKWQWWSFSGEEQLGRTCDVNKTDTNWSNNLSSHSASVCSQFPRRCLRSVDHQDGSAGHPCGCSGTC